ncbi:hypothetical protein A3D60_00690 [Candidatus Uhrbacteria bacterium RIFCSPHIGHO2_02_FULL_47_29]|nr:MAG: hypothetical protein A3D60_00690 [Candidatus Uhrbacteria bacterium RIFCSPHIGHO2_02_FULL_47_29]
MSPQVSAGITPCHVLRSFFAPIALAKEGSEAGLTLGERNQGEKKFFEIHPALSFEERISDAPFKLRQGLSVVFKRCFSASRIRLCAVGFIVHESPSVAARGS